MQEVCEEKPLSVHFFHRAAGNAASNNNTSTSCCVYCFERPLEFFESEGIIFYFHTMSQGLVISITFGETG